MRVSPARPAENICRPPPMLNERGRSLAKKRIANNEAIESPEPIEQIGRNAGETHRKRAVVTLGKPPRDAPSDPIISVIAADANDEGRLIVHVTRLR